MSEAEEMSTAEHALVCVLSCPQEDATLGEPEDPLRAMACGYCIEDALAAAEERGRRRGLEEAAKEADALAAIVAGGVGMGGPYALALVAAKIRALAPRDSAPDGEKLMRDLRDSATVSTRPPLTRDSGKVP